MGRVSAAHYLLRSLLDPDLHFLFSMPNDQWQHQKPPILSVHPAESPFLFYEEAIMSAQFSECDVVLVGAGPCELFFSACLARLGYKIKHIDKRPEPTHSDRADGFQPRSLEVMSTMGLKDDIMSNGPERIENVAFWESCDTGFGISRTVAWTSWPESTGARYTFITTLHQELIEKVFIRDLEKQGITVQRPWYLESFEVRPKDHKEASASHPVHVSVKESTMGSVEHVNARYLLSGEGARSVIRDGLGIQMSYKESSGGDICGVVVARISTSFPDVKVSRNSW